MRETDRRGIQVHATEEGLGKALDFAEDMLHHSSVSSQIVSETMVVFEALFSLMLMQGYDSDTEIDISGESSLGDLSLKIGFEGKRFNPSYDGEGGASPELMIVEGYGEKLSHSHHHGYNVMRISVRVTPGHSSSRAASASCLPSPPICSSACSWTPTPATSCWMGTCSPSSSYLATLCSWWAHPSPCSRS